MTASPPFTGPILILDDLRDGDMHLSALILGGPDGTPPPLLVGGARIPCTVLSRFAEVTVWRARFTLGPDLGSDYAWNGQTYSVACDLTGDLRFAYVSCNGEEHGDLSRDPEERNVMWRRLGADHDASPFTLLLHGGDQIYADEVTDGHPLTRDWPLKVPEVEDAAALSDLRGHLRDAFAHRYVALYAQPAFAKLAARVPSLMQWDDHDICDGWGSLPEEATASAVGQTLFAAAREATLIFQHGCVDGDLPPRFDDPSGEHLGWAVEASDLRLVAPDLRSGRSLTTVMAPAGWTAFEAQAEAAPSGHTFVLSSVPLLGPRLSLVERVMGWLPGIQKYEDDLRDQWQSRAHRDAWVRVLHLVSRMARSAEARVTALSGEIHLATRAEMALAGGKTLHQLVASGITHRAPPMMWARILGALAALGEDPVPHAPIRILPLPGQRRRYTAERNALVLTRDAGAWSASWMLERTGQTPPLPLD
ncbi:hypothetical protein JANAI62_20390 [Jannaschia pagri]|uniref:PhoD-like phosphatase domain-containing protein n=1 Tax=Jannaschia pagri TaxID=2829797 RepID=A0ABQ4NM37_9RHOB|nr:MULTISPECIES: alkaline phosphatase D family protein [unclassified Jannaschia]GIT91582.1 hypothetical protein JANAI61_20400 [Jannaschia sp. AI_61]GIT95416.1 hypothetical protein JANAI62_20390 [Jannaschia sp. AI_62]